jgi:hypothetical protein
MDALPTLEHSLKHWGSKTLGIMIGFDLSKSLRDLAKALNKQNGLKPYPA